MSVEPPRDSRMFAGFRHDQLAGFTMDELLILELAEQPGNGHPTQAPEVRQVLVGDEGSKLRYKQSSPSSANAA
ncbi:MAG: hypothetical protein ACOYMP_04090 [Nodosilinea sp.]